MELPNFNRALIDRDKVVGYLLNPVHPDNGGKATFFSSLGFTPDEWFRLAGALRELAARGTVAKILASAHGVKYIVDGRIDRPDGQSPVVRTVWIVEQVAEAPRLVTAYPRR
jgi:hypothetical protein